MTDTVVQDDSPTLEDLYEQVLGPTAEGDLLPIILAVVRDIHLVAFYARCSRVCKAWKRVREDIPSPLQRLKLIYDKFGACRSMYSTDQTSSVVTDALCLRIAASGFTESFVDIMDVIVRYGGWQGRESRRLKTLERFIEFPSMRTYTIPSTALMRRAKYFACIPSESFEILLFSNQIFGQLHKRSLFPERVRVEWGKLLKVLTKEYIIILSGTIPFFKDEIVKDDILAAHRPHTCWYIKIVDSTTRRSTHVRIPYYVCKSICNGMIGQDEFCGFKVEHSNKCLGPVASAWEVAIF